MSLPERLLGPGSATPSTQCCTRPRALWSPAKEEAQSIQFPITGILLVGYFFAFTAAESPDSLAAVVGSLFPPTAPMVMTVRIANGGVPWWQIALSVALMVVSVYGRLQLAGRIYAGAVLRIGGRVRLKEAWRGGEA